MSLETEPHSITRRHEFACIGGWAIQTGKNTISVDPADPFWKGFQVI